MHVNVLRILMLTLITNGYFPMQTKGQATVPAPRAQVLYSLAPVWSAIIAQLTLGGESIGIFSWIGGSAILLASVLASQPARKQLENETVR